jgi:hypothetical protein
MHRAGTALGDAATEFGAGLAEHSPQDQSRGMSSGASKVFCSPLIFSVAMEAFQSGWSSGTTLFGRKR